MTWIARRLLPVGEALYLLFKMMQYRQWFGGHGKQLLQRNVHSSAACPITTSGIDLNAAGTFP